MRQPLILLGIATLFATNEQSRTHRSSRSTADELLETGYATIGGRAAYRDLGGMRISFSRAYYNPGQEEWVGAPAVLTSSMDGIEFLDFRRPGLLTRYHLPNAPRMFTRLFLADSAAFLFDTIASAFAGGAPAQGYQPIWRNDPIRLLRSVAGASADRARAIGSRPVTGRPALGVEVLAAEDTVRLWFDAKTRVPLAIERVEDDPVSATQVTLVTLAGWVTAGPIRIPGAVVVTQNGRIAQAQAITQAQVNPNADSAFASVPKKPATPSSTSSLAVVEIAPGVYRAEGSPAGVPYNSVFTRTNDSVFVFDPPMNDRYASAIIDSVKGRFPTARARVFVVSHHHSDHVGGARAAFAAGMSAIASAEIADYVRGLGVAPGKKAPGNRRVAAVEDTLAVGSGPSRFVLYPVPTGHVRGLMMAYFPDAKLIAEVDLAAGPPADQRDLYDFVVKRGLTVEKLARMHGEVLPWATFARRFQK
jgi:glyoxylase-like metal-dependent hydrolase (beta-lactamase superfamily II)